MSLVFVFAISWPQQLISEFLSELFQFCLNYLSDLFQFVKPAKEEPLIENDPPMESYNQDHWINFEERVRMELRALGLLEPDVVYIPPPERQDDEICAELRVLHQKLRREVEINNKKRLLFAHLVQQKQIQQGSLSFPSLPAFPSLLLSLLLP